MNRKGQYLPVETVLSFGLGLMIAVATIAGFTTYREEILDTAEKPQIEVIENRMSEVLYTVHSLDTDDSMVRTVELPGTVAGRGYDIALVNGELRIAVGEELYVKSYNALNESHDFRGSASGGSVNIMKRGNQIVLRDR